MAKDADYLKYDLIELPTLKNNSFFNKDLLKGINAVIGKVNEIIAVLNDSTTEIEKTIDKLKNYDQFVANIRHINEDIESIKKLFEEQKNEKENEQKPKKSRKSDG